MSFENRQHAGQVLAKAIHHHKIKASLVLALPRGGVPVAAEISKMMDLPLDVLVVRKIGAPFHSEFAVGAIAEDLKPMFFEHTLSQVGLEPDDLKETIKIEAREVQRQVGLFRGGRKLPLLTKESVILVDDGLATGATVSAAIKYLKTKGVHQIVLAIPVGATATVQSLKPKVHSVVVPEQRDDLLAVGLWYHDFSQVSDEEVVSLLKSAPRKNESRPRANL